MSCAEADSATCCRALEREGFSSRSSVGAGASPLALVDACDRSDDTVDMITVVEHHDDASRWDVAQGLGGVKVKPASLAFVRNACGWVGCWLWPLELPPAGRAKSRAKGAPPNFSQDDAQIPRATAWLALPFVQSWGCLTHKAQVRIDLHLEA